MDTHVKDNLTWLYDTIGGQVKTTQQDVVNTTSETDLLNGEITLAAGAMGTARACHASLLGDYLNNTGATLTTTIRVKFGGTTVFQDDLQTSASANRRAWRIELDIGNLGSGTAQFTEGRLELSAANAPTTGVGSINAGGAIYPFASSGASAVDTTGSVALAVTAQHGTAHASGSMRLHYARVTVA